MKKKGWMILLAFLAGILLANLSGKELLTNFGILNAYYLEQYTAHGIDCDRLFCIVLLERMKAVLAIVILGKLVRGRNLFFIVESILGAMFGFLLAAAVTNLGLSGMAVMLGAMFPQWLFYQADIFLYTKYRQEIETTVRYGRTEAKKWMASVGVFLMFAITFLLGVLTESYLNPYLLDKILKIF